MVLQVALTTPSLVAPVRSLTDDPMLLEAGLQAASRGVRTPVSARPVSLTTVFDGIRSPLLLPPPILVQRTTVVDLPILARSLYSPP
jgi:hypothetical protein